MSVIEQGVARTEVDRARRPAAAEPHPLKLPPARGFSLESGLALYASERRGLPEAFLCLVLEAGAAAEPPGRAGVADLTARLLARGAAGRDARETAAWTDRLGARFWTVVNHEVALLFLHCVSPVLGEALRFLAAVLREPAFAPAEMARARGELLGEIQRQAFDPAATADQALASAVYGAHLYGRPARGTYPGVAGVDEDAVRAFHAAHHGPRDAVLVACGDVDGDALARALDRELAGWGPGAGRVPTPPAPGRPAHAGEILLLDRPGSTTAELRVGAVGAPMSSPDLYTLLVAGEALGGAFHSRLNLRLRGEKGWTYGARARFRFRRAAGPFAARAQVEGAVAAEALAELAAEVHAMGVRPPEGEELARAQRSLALSLPLEFESNGQVARKLADRLVYGAAEDHWERFADRTAAVTSEHVAEAARRYLSRDRTVLLVAGDAQEIGPALEALGPIRLRSAGPRRS